MQFVLYLFNAFSFPHLQGNNYEFYLKKVTKNLVILKNFCNFATF